MTDLVAAVSLAYFAGDDVELEFTITDDSGLAVDISGMTVRFAIARTAGSTAVASTEASPQTATSTVTNGAGGVFQVVVPAANTSDLRGTYRFEAEIEDGSGDKSTVAWGYVTFKAPVIQ
jgi:hypothetical protein